MENFSFRKRIKSFKYAFKGILLLLKTQHNAWIHLTITAIVIIAGVLFELTTNEWTIIVLCIGFVLSAEAVNTAIEYLTDLVSPEWDEKAGKIKDLAAGAVLIAAIAAATSGILIFGSKIIELYF